MFRYTTCIAMYNHSYHCMVMMSSSRMHMAMIPSSRMFVHVSHSVLQYNCHSPDRRSVEYCCV